MDIDKKKNVIRVVKNIWFVIASVLAVCFIVLMGFSCASMNKNKNNNSNVATSVEVVNRIQPKLVSYNDNDYQITLTDNELNNYVWDNLAYLLENHPQSDYLADTSIFNYTDNVTYELDEYSADGFAYVFNNSLITYYHDSGSSRMFYFELNEVATEFSNGGIVWTLNNTIYSDIKNAIELDIQANTHDIIGNGGIFDNISSSVVGFVGTLSSGITAMVGVFYNNGALTVIGLLSVIVVAISLAYFFFRMIMGLIRMRG